MKLIASMRFMHKHMNNVFFLNSKKFNIVYSKLTKTKPYVSSHRFPEVLQHSFEGVKFYEKNEVE